MIRERRSQERDLQVQNQAPGGHALPQAAPPPLPALAQVRGLRAAASAHAGTTGGETVPLRRLRAGVFTEDHDGLTPWPGAVQGRPAAPLLSRFGLAEAADCTWNLSVNLQDKPAHDRALSRLSDVPARAPQRHILKVQECS